uniref:Transmembrane protein n=1 Tax=Fagus sylvatica TaxID=28930 RepID=A0A2N9EY45_FAGSY
MGVIDLCRYGLVVAGVGVVDLCHCGLVVAGVDVVDLCCGGFGGCFELPVWVWLICVAVVWWLPAWVWLICVVVVWWLPAWMWLGLWLICVTVVASVGVGDVCFGWDIKAPGHPGLHGLP